MQRVHFIQKEVLEEYGMDKYEKKKHLWAWDLVKCILYQNMWYFTRRVYRDSTVLVEIILV